MDYQNILITEKGALLHLTINREKQLNALNKLTLQEISSVLDTYLARPNIKGIVLTGAGEKAFVAGADIKEFADYDAAEAKLLAQNGQNQVFDKIANYPKPIIAAINGFALGGGLELALAAHIRLASENAKMGLPEVTLGLIPGYGGTQRLTAAVGKGRATEMICTGEMISAQQAYEIGLVNHVLSPEMLIPKAEEILNKMAERAPLAITKALKAIEKAGKPDGYALEIDGFSKCFDTQDFKEGVAAFLEKRKAQFEGK